MRCYNSVNERQERKEVPKCLVSLFSSLRCSLSFPSQSQALVSSLSQVKSGGCRKVKGGRVKALPARS
nr:MAG TPA: hypothetical protein [Caudoviricetes sp.]